MASLKTNAAYRVATWLAQGELHVAGRMLRPPGHLARAKLKMARKLLGIVLADIPRSWNSLWIAGKIHDRLQVYRLALDCFEQGLAANPSQPDLAIEASLAAVYLGAGSEAEKYAQIAVAARPTSHKGRTSLAFGEPPDLLEVSNGAANKEKRVGHTLDTPYDRGRNRRAQRRSMGGLLAGGLPDLCAEETLRAIVAPYAAGPRQPPDHRIRLQVPTSQ